MGERKQSVPVLPWMRDPVDVTLSEECPLECVPCLHPKLKLALQNMGISRLFPVQIAVWEETVGPGNFERDLCINSPTGSGKTLAYALPIVQMLSNRVVKCLRALVVVPTRDLALQVKEVFDAIASPLGLHVGLAVGQSSIADEISKLVDIPGYEVGMCYDPEDISLSYQLGFQSKVDILVATPGRLMDHITTTKGFTLEHLYYLVVDETDRLLREAYQSWLPTVLELTRSKDKNSYPLAGSVLRNSFSALSTRRRCGVERGFKDKPYPRLAKMVLSATITQDPGKLVQLDLHHPVFLKAGQMRYRLPENLESLKVICETKVKPLYLAALLKSLGGEKCIVFTKSVDSTHHLCKLLNYFSDLQIKIKEYSSLRRQHVRSKTLKEFRKGEFQVLVSSDAMTRGMDVEGVRNVVNYDMPKYIKTYVHRAGRTARAGHTGRCFTLLSKDEARRFKKLLQKADNSSCCEHFLPSSLIEELHATYQSALKKFKETVSEARKKPKISSETSQANKTSEKDHRGE
ncbi:DEAD-box ATP-dependent RNA helicase 1-like isoform X1 [Neltuma alba]|uniref:DEAD-box ATP-dependent RNA helicase 1-like isoform X1 n=1 Tax=Neltuma alba TaxID=207710 RepID=UPI0010A59F9E|nr:DEAD-box ATP-dependent RNA helicase 1-like isoform X1 [Prosopis alba]XP_028791634.1 DEAD-box ATP-dependent RNA helicase 1-like isoform X1 [Prosopis alba]XP_028804540.1 DEAD-box ATP-dependent RNA helicase 1-like isoform X1 [Prosopis alba]XP_028804541.1 DEAD-box ATP-dependent RNA helicase 1-like isoform X1 [Prosopis alba]XP_028804543.1 DEAD-box ATP-dependent RNA helicase 1-like isoform X1 [Prosopis alba]